MEKPTQHQREVTLDAGEANFKAMAFAIPALLLFGVPYFVFWGPHFDNNALLSTMVNIYALPALLGGIIVHEFIHGFFWSLYAKKGFRSIHFGIKWKFLTPYCHCDEPLNVGEYRVGIIMPAIILGVIPSVTALITGSMAMLVFGIFFTMAAGGDFLMMFLLSSARKDELVQDHPTKIGCIMFGKS